MRGYIYIKKVNKNKIGSKVKGVVGQSNGGDLVGLFFFFVREDIYQNLWKFVLEKTEEDKIVVAVKV